MLKNIIQMLLQILLIILIFMDKNQIQNKWNYIINKKKEVNENEEE